MRAAATAAVVSELIDGLNALSPAARVVGAGREKPSMRSRSSEPEPVLCCSALRSTTISKQGGELQNMLSIYTNLQALLTRVFEDEDGQGLTEYALILALIAVVAIAALTLLGGKVTDVLNTIASSL